MSEQRRLLVFCAITVLLCAVAIVAVVMGDGKTACAALAVAAAMWIKPPTDVAAPARPAMVLPVILLALSSCSAQLDYHPFGFRSSSVEMTPQASNPIPAGVGGLYTKNSDGLPRLVSSGGTEFLAGETRHVYTYGGQPPSAVTGDCWMDSTQGNTLWCLEDAGPLAQRFDGNAPGPIGCGGTASAGCFTSVAINGAPVDAAWARTCTITSAAAATPVPCLADADVPAGKKAYLLGWHAKVNGATSWATTTSCYVADSSGAGGTGVLFVSMAVAALTGNAFVADHSANVTQATAYATNTGTTAAKGLQLACDANGTGSSLVVTLFGVTK
jgi:hypothetical protein